MAWSNGTFISMIVGKGLFDSKVSAIQHLEECIAEKREEEAV
ncbi:hypothetical protein X964_18045 [Acinetobacter baumannii MDR_MMC4]|nr:hypothetical protein X964_18045 [Acinetobacter baumannii MDR_MMC4]